MDLAEAIQQRWERTDPLTRQVPIERVFIGTAPGSTELPHVTIVPQGEATEPTTTRDYLERRTLRIAAVAETRNEAQSLRELIDRTFHLQPLPLGAATLLAFARLSTGEQQEAAGWQLWSEYEALIHRRR